MAEFTIDISRIRGTITYAPTPSLDPGSLGVIVSKQTIDYGPVTNTSPHYSSTLGVGYPYIPGGSLPNGTHWLIYYSGTMGANDESTVCRVYLLDNRLVSDRVWAFAGCEGPYISSSTPPIPARGTGCSGAFYYTANGTTLEFSFQNNTGAGTLPGSAAYFRDFQLIAIPMDTLAATDLSYAFVSPDHTDPSFSGVPYGIQPPNASVSFETIQNGVTLAPVPLNFTAPETGDYLLHATCAANQNGVQEGQIEYRLIQDGTIGFGTFWKKETEDSRDLLPVNMMYVASYTKNQAVLLELQGKPNGGGVSRFAYHPRIMALRLGAFARKSRSTTHALNPIPVEKVYGSGWQTVASTQITALADTGEYVLVLGRMVAWRTDFGAMMARIQVRETGEVLKDFVVNTNVNGIDYDRSDIFLQGCHLSNTTLTYDLQVCQADGVAGTGWVKDELIVAIGLTKSSGASNTYSIGIDDAAAQNSDSTMSSTGGGGTVTYGAPIDDTSPQNSSSVVDYSYIPLAAGTPAQVRPRLWFYNNDRLAYLRTRTGSSQYADLLNSFGREAYSMVFKYILKWRITQNAADLVVARDKLFGTTGMFTQDIVQLLWGSDHTDSGFMYRFVMRDLSLALDWLYDDAGVDVATTANGFPANARVMLRNAILALSSAKLNPVPFSSIDPAIGVYDPLNGRWSGGPGSWLSWANTDTHNNHFYDMMMGATYGACTLYGESPTTFKYKPGAANTWLSGSTYQFTIPYHIYSGNPTNYDNLWDWVIARVDNMMVPTLDTDIVGGFTEEGTRYGLVSAVYMTEMFNILNTCAGRTYISDHQCFADHGYFQLYSAQPGVSRQINLGDHPSDSRAPIYDLNRLIALEVVDALPNHPVAPYLQYWMNHKVPSLSEGNYEGLDFLMYRDTRPETNIAGLPLSYVAAGTGFWNSRDSWADTGVSVSMSACSHGEEHHHSDFGALQIYKGDSPNPGDAGWMLIDINLKSGVGDNWDLVAHSADTFSTAGNTTGWPQQYFGTPPVAPPPPDTAPSAPALVSPLNGTTNVVLPPTFTWTSSSGATSYGIQVSTDLGFATVTYSASGITGTSVSVPGLSNSTVYYWHVNATNSGGTSGYSITFLFQTEAGGTPPPPPSGVKVNEDTSSLQIFPANNWWNMDVSAWPVDTNSAAYITLLNGTSGLGNPAGVFHPDWGNVSSTYGIPYIGVDSTQPLVPVTLGSYASESDTGQPGQPTGTPIPTQAHTTSGVTAGYREEGGDNHMLIFDRQRNYLYELYHASWNGSSWSADQQSCFQMNTNARRPEGWTSTDAAGLAVFPGLVKYDDIHGSGPIRHATRFACKSANGYIYPASHVGGASTTNHHVAGFLPFGGRIRLKPSFDIATFVNGFSSLSAANKAGMTLLLQSWKTYGLIFADTGGNGAVQGTMDNRWVPGEFNQILHGLHFSSFDVLELGKIGP